MPGAGVDQNPVDPAPVAAGRAAAAALAGDRHRIPGGAIERAWKPGAQRSADQLLDVHPRPPAGCRGTRPGEAGPGPLLDHGGHPAVPACASYPHEAVRRHAPAGDDRDGAGHRPPRSCLWTSRPPAPRRGGAVATSWPKNRGAQGAAGAFSIGVHHARPVAAARAGRPESRIICTPGSCSRPARPAEIHREPSHPYTKGPAQLVPLAPAARAATLAGIPGSPLTCATRRPAARSLPRCGVRQRPARAGGGPTCICWQVGPRPKDPGAPDGLPRFVLPDNGRPPPPRGCPPGGNRRPEKSQESRRDRAGDHADLRRPRRAGSWPWRRSPSARTSRSAAARSCTPVRDVLPSTCNRGAVVRALVGEESGSGKSDRRPALAWPARNGSPPARSSWTARPVEVKHHDDFRRYKSQVQYVLPRTRFASLNPVQHRCAITWSAPPEAAPRQGREHRQPRSPP